MKLVFVHDFVRFSYEIARANLRKKGLKMILVLCNEILASYVSLKMINPVNCN